MHTEVFDFQNNPWIGLRLGECPASHVQSADEEFLHLSLDAIEKGIPKKSSTLFRAVFTPEKPIRSAVVRTVGLGYYEFFINGSRIGDKTLTPCTTDFIRKIPYDVYDVTALLQSGQNVLSYHLGGGWFNPDPQFADWRFIFYGNPRFLLSLRITFADGTEQEYGDKLPFKWHDGPVTEMSLYGGEKYDARLLPIGWNTVSFDDADWTPAQIVEAPGGALVENDCPPIREISVHTPTKVQTIAPNKTVYSFAENLTGRLRIRVRGSTGAAVTVIHSEHIFPDGTLDLKSMNKAENRDVYTLCGGGVETYEPHFVWRSFRYVCIEVCGDAEILSAEQVEVRSDVPVTGKFMCSEPEINTLHEKFLRTQLNCLMGVPIDCPQRDERLGWMGDAWATAAVCTANLDMKTFYENFLEDIRLTQKPNGAVSHICPWFLYEEAFDWSVGYPIILYQYYKAYGDKQTTARHFDPLLRFHRYIAASAENGIVPRAKYGDWMSVLPDFKRGDPDGLSTMLFCWFTQIMLELADILNDTRYTAELQSALSDTKSAILKTYYDPENKHFVPDCQCSNALGLMLSLCPASDADAVLAHLIADIRLHDGCLTTGILGTRFLAEALEKYGRADVLYALLMQDKYPSWRHLLRGHTTLAEEWDGSGSGCHCMFDSVDAYLFSTFAGLRIDHTAEYLYTVAPAFCKELQFVRCSMQTADGLFAIDWKREGARIIAKITVPDGKTALFRLPDSLSGSSVRVNGAICRADHFEIQKITTIETETTDF